MIAGFIETMQNLALDSGFANLDFRYLIMILVSFVLMYLAIVKEFEPLLLLPIAFGMFLVNLPGGGLMMEPAYDAARMLLNAGPEIGEGVLEQAESMLAGGEVLKQAMEGGDIVFYGVKSHNGGLLYYLYQGVKLGIYPPLIFFGIGAMTDFGPLIANPKSFLLGAAAQIGIFLTFVGAMLFGFSGPEAGAIGIIGGADGPTAIYTTSILAPDLLPSIAVAAYSYMALVPIIQPPIMRFLTNDKERQVVMTQLRPVSKTEKIIFPVMTACLVILLVPDTAPLIGMLTLGNLCKESGVVDRITKTAQNELMNIVTIFLGVSVGATSSADKFLTPRTLFIILLGLIAFCFGTAAGVLFGKLMYKLTGGKVNPLIGSAGVSAVPMAARVSQKVGQEYNPTNYLLMHAMGPNVAGVIGSAVAAGVLISVLS